MPATIISKNRRSSTDRRKHSPTYDGIERRSSIDRRLLDEKLKHLIESNMKEKTKESKSQGSRISGKVIRRRKSKNKPKDMADS